MFRGRINLAHIGIFGHSRGGLAAAMACQHDRRFKACLNMDGGTLGGPFYADANATPPTQPFMWFIRFKPEPSDEQLQSFKMTRQQWDQNRDRVQSRVNGFLSGVKGGSYRVTLNGAKRPLLEYWKAQEGEFALAGAGLSGRAGGEAPVVHLDQSGPLRSDRDGRVLVGGAWGIYFRMGRTGTGITGGGLPVFLSRPRLDPYGPDNPEHGAEPAFRDFFVSGLATALRRFRGRSGEWRLTPAGGVVSHTPDNYPVCDWVLANAYAIVDSGHGFKTLAVGRLAADDIMDGGEPLLEPFRLDRFERGMLHAASKGPYPWT